MSGSKLACGLSGIQPGPTMWPGCRQVTDACFKPVVILGGGFGGAHALEEHGHGEGRHLVVGKPVGRVLGDDLGDLLGRQHAAVPLALGFEALVRAFLLPPEFEEVREFLGPAMTVFASAMVVVTLATVLIGILLQRWMTRRAELKAPEQGKTPITRDEILRIDWDRFEEEILRDSESL